MKIPFLLGQRGKGLGFYENPAIPFSRLMKGCLRGKIAAFHRSSADDWYCPRASSGRAAVSFVGKREHRHFWIIITFETPASLSLADSRVAWARSVTRVRDTIHCCWVRDKNDGIKWTRTMWIKGGHYFSAVLLGGLLTKHPIILILCSTGFQDL